VAGLEGPHLQVEFSRRVAASDHAKLAAGWFILASQQVARGRTLKTGGLCLFAAAERKVFYKKVPFIKKVL